MTSALLQKTPYGSFGGQPGGVLSKTKRDQSPSVLDKEELPLTTEELARSLAERDAIGPPTVGPVSIDPTDWLTPGGLAKVGAVLKGVLTGSAASPLLVGAFRSANNTMLAREMVQDSRNLLAVTAKGIEEDIQGGYIHPAYVLHKSIIDKLSDKELAKYGTPEFRLDKWLHSTNTLGNATPQGIREVTPTMLIEEGASVFENNENKVDRIVRLASGTSSNPIDVEKSINRIDNSILWDPVVPLLEDFNFARKQGKKLLLSDNTRTMANDVDDGIHTLVGSIQDHKIDPATLENKSLQQIVSIVNKADDDAIRVLKKSIEAKSQVIRARTGELFNAQMRSGEMGDAPAEFVRLETSQDLAQETDILNHCIGAVGRDNDKYIPAFDTVTGKPAKNLLDKNTSFAEYNQAMADKKSEFYSYRPKGLPEVTLEVSNFIIPGKPGKGALKTIKQVYGKEDRLLTPQEGDAVAEFARAKGIKFNRKRFVDESELNWPPDWEPLIDEWQPLPPNN